MSRVPIDMSTAAAFPLSTEDCIVGGNLGVLSAGTTIFFTNDSAKVRVLQCFTSAIIQGSQFVQLQDPGALVPPGSKTLIIDETNCSIQVCDAERIPVEVGDRIILCVGKNGVPDAIGKWKRLFLNAPYKVLELADRKTSLVISGVDDPSYRTRAVRPVENPDGAQRQSGVASRGKVSVIIPTYNRAKYISSAIDSVLSQSYPDFEVIVVNDGSTDNTEEIIREKYWNKVTYLKKDNGGKASALNLGLKEATGDYVWLLDDDDMGLPGKLLAETEFLENNPHVDIVFSIALCFNDTTGEILSPWYWFNVPFDHDQFLVEMLEDLVVCGQSSLARRRSFDEVGLFREDLVRNQDHEMFIRFVRTCNVALLPEPTALVRIHTGDRGSSNHRFRPESLEKVGLVYKQKYLKAIYDSLELVEINPLLKRTPDDPSQVADALLKLGFMRINNGLFEDAVATLCQFEDVLNTSPVSIQEWVKEKIITLQSSSEARGIVSISNKFLRRLARSACHAANGREFKKSLLKKYYWLIREKLDNKLYLQGVLWIRNAFILF